MPENSFFASELSGLNGSEINYCYGKGVSKSLPLAGEGVRRGIKMESVFKLIRA